MNVTVVLSAVVAIFWVATVLWVAYAVFQARRKQPIKAGLTFTIVLCRRNSID